MAVKKSTAKRKPSSVDEEHLPSLEDAHASFAPAQGPDLERVRQAMLVLKETPPQVLHLEGGLSEQRFSLGLWWSAALNCPEAGLRDAPCLHCPACLQAGAKVDADLIILDGRAGSIKIDDVRGLKPLLGEAPRHGRKRLVLLAEAHALTLESANSLLKVLEEPCPDTCFLFTVPQRERLLPTLVSRGWVLSLPWPDPVRPVRPVLDEWGNALAVFILEGRGWFDRTSAKGALDSTMAQEVVLLGQKALSDCLADRKGSRLSEAFSRLSPEELLAAEDLMAQCQEALQAQVNPALVLDWMASRLNVFVDSKTR